MDFEAYLRTLIRDNASFDVKLGLNDEGRVLLGVEAENSLCAFFIIVENTAHQLGPAVDTNKPTPQRVVAEGFDAHKGMGAK